jgi:hypothetical protein
MSVAMVVAADAIVPLELTIEQEGVGGITGKAPTVRLREASTPDYYLDWADNLFKTSGWTQLDAPLTEASRGHYSRSLSMAAVSATLGNIFSAEYHVDDGGDVKGDDADIIIVGQDGLISFVGLEADVKLIRQSITNRMEEFPGTPGHLILWDDDGVTPRMAWTLRDAAGNGIVATAGAPAKRSVGT